MSLLNASPLLAAAGGEYEISRSVRLRSSASAYFNRTPASAGSQTTWTMSMWVKRGALGVRQFITMSGTNPNSSQVWQVEFDANNKLDFFNQAIGTYRRTTQVFRDVGAWYHIVFGADTNNATAQNRFRCWVNGVEVTAWDVNSTISSGYSFAYNGAYLHGIGAYTYSGNGLPFDGYLTEVNFIDGQALTPSSFGETDAVTGVWKPKKYAGTYGTNGFYLNFSDPSAATAAAIGKDYSGNGNNWTPNNISVTAGVTYDSMLDVPTPYADGGNGRGNYAVLNPADFIQTGAAVTNGNLTVTTTTAGLFGARGTIGVSSGKWYFEATHVGTYSIIGVDSLITPINTNNRVGGTATSYGYYNGSGNKYNNNVATAYGNSYTTNDVVGVALDLDNGKIWFSKNGVWQASGDPVAGTNAAYTGLSGIYTAAFSDIDTSSGGGSAHFNFGQRPFAYTPPTGFKALNTQNLPEPTIKKGNQYFDATTYTGNGGTQSIVNSGGMQPDLVWIKRRQAAADHALYDSSRPLGVALASNSTGAEGAVVTNGLLTAYNSNGFSVAVVSGDNTTNGSAGSYVGWQWKESATAGFDIVTYTGTGVNGQTVAHNLGVTPAMIVIKKRVNNTATNTGNWIVLHQSIAATGSFSNSSTFTLTNYANALLLNGTGAMFSYNYDNQVGGNGDTFVAYLFAQVPGFSRFGSYTGNGSADGAFVFCGFRPRFVLMKRTNSTAGWTLFDTARNQANVTDLILTPNASSAENTFTSLDILSNGFKLRSTDAGLNGSGDTYIFAAFAEHPFKNAIAR